MKAIVRLDVPDYQIGQEVHVYFKDSMTDKGICEEEKVGHWELLSNELYMCSECYAKWTMKLNYCPNCGARMESEE